MQEDDDDIGPLDIFDPVDILNIRTTEKRDKKKERKAKQPKPPKQRTSRAIEIANSPPDYFPSTSSPIDVLLESRANDASGSTLTYKQRKAIRLFVSYEYTDEMVAAEIGVPLTTIKQWQENKEFQRELSANEVVLTRATMKERLHSEREIVRAIHEEALLRIHSGELRKIPLKDLLKLAKEMAHETRLDDPASVTSRNENIGPESPNITLNIIQDRFNIQRVRKEQQQKKALIAAENNVGLQRWLQEKNVSPAQVTIEAEIEPSTKPK